MASEGHGGPSHSISGFGPQRVRVRVGVQPHQVTFGMVAYNFDFNNLPSM